MSTPRPTLVLCLLLAGIASLGSPGQVAAQVTSERHCVITLAPVATGQRGSAVLGEQCFATFAEALFVASDGTISLDPSVGPAQVTDAMLASGDVGAASLYPIGFNYTGQNYGGSSLTINGDTTQKCSSGYQYGFELLPGGWNDVISSARTTSLMGCINNYMYEHSYYGGAVLNCFSGCQNMGSMDNKTSSERWTG